ncbi:MAG: hypothetical protein ACK40L_19495, partial [Hydrogenophaga sp.]
MDASARASGQLTCARGGTGECALVRKREMAHSALAHTPVMVVVEVPRALLRAPGMPQPAPVRTCAHAWWRATHWRV